MPLSELQGEPSYMTQEQHALLQESTPSTFQGHDPILRLKLDNVRCLLQPARSWFGEHGQEEGTLYVTEGAISFLPASSTSGFTLDYPSLSLHAISRSVPQLLQGAGTLESGTGCVYCQLDVSSAEADEQDDEEDEMAELWLLPKSQDDLEPLFDALSRCASLHPSTSNDDGGNPFASFGAFGTGLTHGEHTSNGVNGNEDGAFDDADEVQDPNGDGSLSETGRATLLRLDALLDSDNQELSAPSTSPPASFHSADPRRRLTSQVSEDGRSCTLILVNIPRELFNHAVLASALLDLLHAYGRLHFWTPLPSFGRAIVVYQDVDGAQRAKDALDRLLLPLIDEGEEETVKFSDEGLIEKQNDREGLALRAYYGNTEALSRLQSDMGIDHLPVPTTDRNFLISPPGSPPVGWEPIKEDPPNTNTLADDLIRALGSLRDRGLGVNTHTPTILDGSQTRTPGKHHSRSPSASTLMPPAPPSVIIPPSRTAVRSYHPLTHMTFDAGHETDGDGTISLPGVTVQNVDSHEDAAREAAEGLDLRLNKNLSISSVKATVESMRGGGGGLNERITPTARPPV